MTRYTKLLPRKRRMKENDDFLNFVKRKKRSLDQVWRRLSWQDKLVVNVYRVITGIGVYKTGYKDLVDMARKEYEPNL